MSEVFKNLANDEKNHAERYTQLIGQRKIGEVSSTEEERQQADYNIKVLEDTGVVDNLRKGSERAKEIKNLESALEAAVRMEKDTIIFYSNMAMGLGRPNRDQVYKIIGVEHNHLYKVQNLLG